VDKFEEMLSTNVRQVLNFYSQHWPEPVTGIVLSAVAYRAQAEEGIRSYTTLPIIPFTLAEETQIRRNGSLRSDARCTRSRPTPKTKR